MNRFKITLMKLQKNEWPPRTLFKRANLILPNFVRCLVVKLLVVQKKTNENVVLFIY